MDFLTEHDNPSGFLNRESIKKSKSPKKIIFNNNNGYKKNSKALLKLNPFMNESLKHFLKKLEKYNIPNSLTNQSRSRLSNSLPNLFIWSDFDDNKFICNENRDIIDFVVLQSVVRNTYLSQRRCQSIPNLRRNFIEMDTISLQRLCNSANVPQTSLEKFDTYNTSTNVKVDLHKTTSLDNITKERNSQISNINEDYVCISTRVYLESAIIEQISSISQNCSLVNDIKKQQTEENLQSLIVEIDPQRKIKFNHETPGNYILSQDVKETFLTQLNIDSVIGHYEKSILNREISDQIKDVEMYNLNEISSNTKVNEGINEHNDMQNNETNIDNNNINIKLVNNQASKLPAEISIKSDNIELSSEKSILNKKQLIYLTDNGKKLQEESCDTIDTYSKTVRKNMVKKHKKNNKRNLAKSFSEKSPSIKLQINLSKTEETLPEESNGVVGNYNLDSLIVTKKLEESIKQFSKNNENENLCLERDIKNVHDNNLGRMLTTTRQSFPRKAKSLQLNQISCETKKSDKLVKENSISDKPNLNSPNGLFYNSNSNVDADISNEFRRKLRNSCKIENNFVKHHSENSKIQKYNDSHAGLSQNITKNELPITKITLRKPQRKPKLKKKLKKECTKIETDKDVKLNNSDCDLVEKINSQDLLKESNEYKSNTISANISLKPPRKANLKTKPKKECRKNKTTPLLRDKDVKLNNNDSDLVEKIDSHELLKESNECKSHLVSTNISMKLRRRQCKKLFHIYPQRQAKMRTKLKKDCEKIESVPLLRNKDVKLDNSDCDLVEKIDSPELLKESNECKSHLVSANISMKLRRRQCKKLFHIYPQRHAKMRTKLKKDCEKIESVPLLCDKDVKLDNNDCDKFDSQELLNESNEYKSHPASGNIIMTHLRRRSKRHLDVDYSKLVSSNEVEINNSSQILDKESSAQGKHEVEKSEKCRSKYKKDFKQSLNTNTKHNVERKSTLNSEEQHVENALVTKRSKRQAALVGFENMMAMCKRNKRNSSSSINTKYVENENISKSSEYLTEFKEIEATMNKRKNDDDLKSSTFIEKFEEKLTQRNIKKERNEKVLKPLKCKEKHEKIQTKAKRSKRKNNNVLKSSKHLQKMKKSKNVKLPQSSDSMETSDAIEEIEKVLKSPKQSEMLIDNETVVTIKSGEIENDLNSLTCTEKHRETDKVEKIKNYKKENDLNSSKSIEEPEEIINRREYEIESILSGHGEEFEDMKKNEKIKVGEIENVLKLPYIIKIPEEMEKVEKITSRKDEIDSKSKEFKKDLVISDTVNKKMCKENDNGSKSVDCFEEHKEMKTAIKINSAEDKNDSISSVQIKEVKEIDKGEKIKLDELENVSKSPERIKIVEKITSRKCENAEKIEGGNNVNENNSKSLDQVEEHKEMKTVVEIKSIEAVNDSISSEFIIEPKKIENTEKVKMGIYKNDSTSLECIEETVMKENNSKSEEFIKERVVMETVKNITSGKDENDSILSKHREDLKEIEKVDKIMIEDSQSLKFIEEYEEMETIEKINSKEDKNDSKSFKCIEEMEAVKKIKIGEENDSKSSLLKEQEFRETFEGINNVENVNNLKSLEIIKDSKDIEIVKKTKIRQDKNASIPLGHAEEFNKMRKVEKIKIKDDENDRKSLKCMEDLKEMEKVFVEIIKESEDTETTEKITSGKKENDTKSTEFIKELQKMEIKKINTIEVENDTISSSDTIEFKEIENLQKITSEGDEYNSKSLKCIEEHEEMETVLAEIIKESQDMEREKINMIEDVNDSISSSDTVEFKEIENLQAIAIKEYENDSKSSEFIKEPDIMETFETITSAEIKTDSKLTGLIKEPQKMEIEKTNMIEVENDSISSSDTVEFKEIENLQKITIGENENDLNFLEFIKEPEVMETFDTIKSVEIKNDSISSSDTVEFKEIENLQKITSDVDENDSKSLKCIEELEEIETVLAEIIKERDDMEIKKINMIEDVNDSIPSAHMVQFKEIENFKKITTKEEENDSKSLKCIEKSEEMETVLLAFIKESEDTETIKKIASEKKEYDTKSTEFIKESQELGREKIKMIEDENDLKSFKCIEEPEEMVTVLAKIIKEPQELESENINMIEVENHSTSSSDTVEFKELENVQKITSEADENDSKSLKFIEELEEIKTVCAEFIKEPQEIEREKLDTIEVENYSISSTYTVEFKEIEKLQNIAIEEHENDSKSLEFTKESVLVETDEAIKSEEYKKYLKSPKSFKKENKEKIKLLDDENDLKSLIIIKESEKMETKTNKRKRRNTVSKSSKLIEESKEIKISNKCDNVSLEFIEDNEEIKAPKDVKRQRISKKTCQPLGNKMNSYRKIRTNIYIDPKPAHWSKEVERCNCRPSIEKQSLINLKKSSKNSAWDCKDNCLNRVTYTECNARTCPCGDLCSNQKIRKSLWTTSVKIKDLQSKGCGVVATKPIEEGILITEYVGEVINESTFQDRMINVYGDDRHHYCLHLDGEMFIDAYRSGSLARFVNHSCEPNCEMQKWMVNGVYRMCLFSSKEIGAGTELTYDYNFCVFNSETSQVCLCGAAKCRGVIGGRPRVEQSDSQKEKKRLLEVSKRTLSTNEKLFAAKRSVFLFRALKEGWRIKFGVVSNCRRTSSLLLLSEEAVKEKEETRKKNEFLAQMSSLNSVRSVRTRLLRSAERDEALTRRAQLGQVLRDLYDSLLAAKDPLDNGCQLVEPFLRRRSLKRERYPEFYRTIDNSDDSGVLCFSELYERLLDGCYDTMVAFDRDVENVLSSMETVAGRRSVMGRTASRVRLLYGDLKRNSIALYEALTDTVVSDNDRNILLPANGNNNNNTEQPINNDDDRGIEIMKCICGSLATGGEGEDLLQCDYCFVWQHGHCMAVARGLQEPPVLQRGYLCHICLNCPLKSLVREIPLRNTVTKDYKTLLYRDKILLKIDDFVYISNCESISGPESTILKISRLWKEDDGGRRMMEGQLFLRPYHSYLKSSSKIDNIDIDLRLYKWKCNEVVCTDLRQTVLLEEGYGGHCHVLNSRTFMLGRPLPLGGSVYVCDWQFDSQRREWSAMEEHCLNINTKPYCFQQHNNNNNNNNNNSECCKEGTTLRKYTAKELLKYDRGGDIQSTVIKITNTDVSLDNKNVIRTKLFNKYIDKLRELAVERTMKTSLIAQSTLSLFSSPNYFSCHKRKQLNPKKCQIVNNIELYVKNEKVDLINSDICHHQTNSRKVNEKSDVLNKTVKVTSKKPLTKIKRKTTVRNKCDNETKIIENNIISRRGTRSRNIKVVDNLEEQCNAKLEIIKVAYGESKNKRRKVNKNLVEEDIAGDNRNVISKEESLALISRSSSVSIEKDEQIQKDTLVTMKDLPEIVSQCNTELDDRTNGHASFIEPTSTTLLPKFDNIIVEGNDNEGSIDNKW